MKNTCGIFDDEDVNVQTVTRGCKITERLIFTAVANGDRRSRV